MFRVQMKQTVKLCGTDIRLAARKKYNAVPAANIPSFIHEKLVFVIHPKYPNDGVLCRLGNECKVVN